MKIFVVGSYSAETKQEKFQNISLAAAAGVEIFKLGHLPLIAHSMFAFWEERIDSKGFEKLWVDWLENCDGVLVLNPSQPLAKKLVNIATKNNKAVFKSLKSIPIIRIS